jgi:hypothetical protein
MDYDCENPSIPIAKIVCIEVDGQPVDELIIENQFQNIYTKICMLFKFIYIFIMYTVCVFFIVLLLSFCWVSLPF